MRAENACTGKTALIDGARVGYAEFGDPAGAPIVFFHGIPGSRLLGASLHAQALAAGARIIAIERPGCGRSDYRSVRSVAGWAQTVGHVADGLGIGRFSALGVSGGGPYALACGALFPARVGAVGLVSSVGTERMPGVMLRSSRCLVGLGRLAPLLAVPPLALAYRRTTRRLDAVLELLESELAADGVDDPRAAGLLLADLLEAFSSGYRGVAGDCARLRRWGFEPEDVQAPVHSWHGCEDRHVSVAAAAGLSQRLPDCRTRYVPEAGHLGVLPHCADEILRMLVTRPARNLRPARERRPRRLPPHEPTCARERREGTR
jgi:pimeloyl-ACP methyl ester carboxylesterase